MDKFAHCSWRPGPEDTPILDRCANWFAGRIIERLPAGDHHAFLLDPFDGASDPDQEQFTFHRAKRMEPGHEA